MSDRASQIILLCEDEAHERLTKAYLKKCGQPFQPPKVKSLVASREQQGGNDSWVLNRFPDELNACRKHQKKAKTLLIVVIDADSHSVDDRRRQLFDRVKAADFEEFAENEPAVILIPKRHIETWISVLLGQTVTEDEDCKPWEKPDKSLVRQAAQTLFEWLRNNATPGSTCVPSLKVALSEWKKVG